MNKFNFRKNCLLRYLNAEKTLAVRKVAEHFVRRKIVEAFSEVCIMHFKYFKFPAIWDAFPDDKNALVVFGAMLCAAKLNKPATNGQLAKFTGLSQPTITKACQSLRGAGLIDESRQSVVTQVSRFVWIACNIFESGTVARWGRTGGCPSAFPAYLALKSFQNKRSTKAYASQAKYAERVQISKRSLMDGLLALEREGFCIPKKQFHRISVYQVREVIRSLTNDSDVFTFARAPIVLFQHVNALERGEPSAVCRLLYEVAEPGKALNLRDGRDPDPDTLHRIKDKLAAQGFTRVEPASLEEWFEHIQNERNRARFHPEPMAPLVDDNEDEDRGDWFSWFPAWIDSLALRSSTKAYISADFEALCTVSKTKLNAMQRAVAHDHIEEQVAQRLASRYARESYRRLLRWRKAHGGGTAFDFSSFYKNKQNRYLAAREVGITLGFDKASKNWRP